MYLSLIFAVLLSLLLALVEGAAMGAARLQAELAADLGLDSVFAEYHRELFRQYGLFFIDDSYGTGRGAAANVEKHLADYMSYNLNPKKELAVVPGSNWIRLDNEYLEIEEASFATDNKGEVWKAQAVEYIKSRYGLDVIQTVQEQLKTVEREQLLSGNLTEQLLNYQKDFEDSLKAKDIRETDKETDDGFSYDSLRDAWNNMIGKGILHFVIPDGAGVSDAVIRREDLVSFREKKGALNKGSGIPDYVKKPDSMIDELLFDEFLMEKYGCYRKEKEGSHLKYQIEYLLYGTDSDVSNLRKCAEQLFLIRSASNYLYLTTIDSIKLNEAKAAAAGISAIICLPELMEALTQMILIVWSMAEAVVDVQTLFDGGKVSVIKQKGEWQLGLRSLLNGGIGKHNANKITQITGVSYEGYLRVFLGAMVLKRDDKVMRSMDIAEMDIRKTAGNENFRIDQCMDYLKVSFGFTGDRGQSYVFTRTMRYE